MYLRYALSVPISLALNLVTYVLAPLLALLSLATGPVLPLGLSLFHTHDDTLDGGQHQLGWPPASGLGLWWQRTRWMWRNPAYGWDAYVFGARGPITIVTGGIGPLGDVTAVFIDGRGTRRFQRRRRLYNIGWNLWDNGTGRHMLKVGFNPFVGVMLAAALAGCAHRDPCNMQNMSGEQFAKAFVEGCRHGP